jgi:dTDP-4-amino-4,6-dideoxy-D-galactose acyltransferase
LVVPYEVLDWDSDHFGFPIGRISDLGPEGLQTAVERADAGGIRCLYLLCPIADWERTRLALDLGFRPYDIRIEFSSTLAGDEPGAESVRIACADDHEKLARLAEERFTATRFWTDRRFPRERVRALYSRWVERGLSTPDERETLVVGEGEGFVICRPDRDRGVGSIELIAVAAGVEGRGLGDSLIRGACHAFQRAGLDRAEVVTQAENIAAQRLYQRHGFRTSSVDVWLHRWVGH